MDGVHKELAAMKFKEWIVSEINKGLARQFQQDHPNLPKYVVKQVLQNRVSPLWKNTMSAKSPTMALNNAHPKLQAIQQTMAYEAPPSNNPNKPTYGSLGDMFKDNAVSSIAGKNNWVLQVVEIHPLNFTQDTIDSFLNHQFGSSPSLSKGVKNHDERMKTQTALAGERGEGENEPIIMVREGDKYKMQEGWHRLYSYLTKFSAPPEEQEKIHNGRSNEVDLTVWRPIKVRAYIGN